VYSDPDGDGPAPLRLAHVAHAHGRLVPTYDGAGQLAGLRYQYALKDHLGNVRALVEPAG
jgi:hypothetical protein